VETAIKATSEIVRDYSRLFVKRGAYTLQSSRPIQRAGVTITFDRRQRRQAGS